LELQGRDLKEANKYVKVMETRVGVLRSVERVSGGVFKVVFDGALDGLAAFIAANDDMFMVEETLDNPRLA